MKRSTRRMLIAGSTLAAAAVMTGARPAAAAAPAQVGRQTASFYRFKVGAAEVTVLSDGFVTRRVEGWVRNAPQAEVEAALQSAFVPLDDIRNVYNITVINTGSRLVMIDAGFADNGQPTTGQMAANLTAAGINPADIDTILVTHFHGDHVNGIRNRAGGLTFSKAEIIVPAAEWAWWMDDGRMAQTPEAARASFNLGRRVFGPNAADVRRIEGEREVVPGITAIPTFGHTPGHTSYVLASGNGRLLIQGDVSGPPIFVRNPGWHSMFDMDGPMAEATRRRLYDMAAVERMLIVGYHFPFPGVGYVAREGNGYRYEPMQWRSTV